MNDRRNDSTWVIWALTLIFVTLKLTNNIDWSWVWVLCPIWIPIAFGVAAGFIGYILKSMKNSERENKRWMDPHENEELLHKMWTGEKDED